MMRRSLLASVVLAACTAMLAVHAGEPNKKGGDDPKVTTGKGGQPTVDAAALLKKEKELADKFSTFQRSLQELHDKLSKSTSPIDQARAKQLEKVLAESETLGIYNRFQMFVKFLSEQKLSNSINIDKAVLDAARLATDLKALVALLKDTNGSLDKRAERQALEAVLKDLEKLIRDEKIVRTQIATNPDKEKVAGDQDDVKGSTQKTADKLGDPNKGNEAAKPGTSKDPGKGDKADGKPGDKGSEAAKPGEAKLPGKETDGDPKAGNKPKDPNAGKPGESPKGNAKPGDPKGGEKGNASAKDPKGGGEGKPGEGKPGEGKPGEGKPGEGKPGDPKGDPKADPKAGNAKPSDPKAGANDKKEGNAKPPQSGEASKAAPKPGDSPKAEAGAAKPSDSPPSDSKPGDAKPGSPSASKPKAGGPPPMGDDDPPAAGKGGPTPPPGKDNPKDDVANTKKKIQDAIEKMEKAKENVEAGKKDDAGKDADGAIKDLETAKKKLEDLIRQLREEELERLLANLITRCQKMLKMQEDVLAGTFKVKDQIDADPKKKEDRDNILAALNLSEKESEIVVEATKAIDLLENEGSAIAFPEIFRQLREDMKHVQRRLKVVDAGEVTVILEQDIIDTLKDMVKALEKAKKDLDDKKNPPKPPPDGEPPPQQDQKLLDKIAELKMLKAMQLRVNSRTELYGKHYPGEQATTDEIRLELRELSNRQEQILDITNKMAKD